MGYHRRRVRGMDSVKMFAGSCLFVFFAGNVLMLQTYRSFVAPRGDNFLGDEAALLDGQDDTPYFGAGRGRNSPGRRGEVRDVFQRYAEEFLPRIDPSVVVGGGGGGDGDGENVGDVNQYSVIEGRVRRLMQNDDKGRFGRVRSKTQASDHSLKFVKSESLNSIQNQDDDDSNNNIRNDNNNNDNKIKDQEYRSFLENFDKQDLLNCADVEKIQNLQFIGSGWTKAVYRGELGGRDVAVKTVDIEGRDVTGCLQKGGNSSTCYSRASRKIVKEIVLLRALQEEFVLKVLGFCVPAPSVTKDANNAVAMVTELGEPIDQIKLLQMSWEDRLKVSYDIVRLVQYLAHTPYGSMALNDFRRTQFVLVNGTVKLSDVDDAGFGEPSCTQHADCSFPKAHVNTSKELGCFNGFCKNHNEFHNILMASHHFTSFLLPHGAPKMLRPLIDQLIDNFEKLTVNSRGLLKEITRIVDLYKAGAYLNRTRQKSDYPAQLQADLPGQFDYRCRFSMSGGACTLSVFDHREAQDICDTDEECLGFVWTRRRTWTGRTIIHLKNGRGTASSNSQTDLYVKPS